MPAQNGLRPIPAGGEVRAAPLEYFPSDALRAGLRLLHPNPRPYSPRLSVLAIEAPPFIAEPTVLSSAHACGLELCIFRGMPSYQVAAGMVREGAAAWKSLPEEAKAFDTLELPFHEVELTYLLNMPYSGHGFLLGHRVTHPSLSLACGARFSEAWITLIEIPLFIYKKRKASNPLSDMKRDDQFLRVFVHILILFVQLSLAELSKLVQSAVHVCSKKRFKNEQR